METKPAFLIVLIAILVSFSALSSPITKANAYTTTLSGSGFGVCFNINEQIGFQDSNLAFIVYFNVTGGKLNATDCELRIYSSHTGYFTFKNLEDCTLHVYSSSPISLYKNSVPVNGYLTLPSMETLTVSWDFTAPVTVHLTVVGSAGGTTDIPAGVYDYLLGSEITITATPSVNYTFKYYLIGAATTNVRNPMTMTLTRDTTVTPVFQAVNVGSHGAPLFGSSYISGLLPVIAGVAIVGLVIMKILDLRKR